MLFMGTAGQPSNATGELDGLEDGLHVSHALLLSRGFVVSAGENLRPAL